MSDAKRRTEDNRMQTETWIYVCRQIEEDCSETFAQKPKKIEQKGNI